MSEESPRKRPRLCEDDPDGLSKPDLVEHIRKQEEYIADLESKVAAGSSSHSAEGEDKARHLKAARREQLLVMRLTTKEQELHELANRLAEKTQNAPTSHLRSAMVDPALNLLIQRLKKELEDKTTGLQQAHEDMAAWKFTPDSQTGKRLMARCRTLIQENQELGKQVSQGKVAQVEAELVLQKEINEELKNSQDEMYEMVVQLNDEGEGMQSTILALQQELKEKQQEILRLSYAGQANQAPGSAHNATSPLDPAVDRASAAAVEAPSPVREESSLKPELQEKVHEPPEPMEEPVCPPKDLQANLQPQIGVDAEPEKPPSPEPMEQDERPPQQEPQPQRTSEQQPQTMQVQIETPEEPPVERMEKWCREEEQVPALRTTEYNDQAAEPSAAVQDSPSEDLSSGPVERDSLSVDTWSNPTHFVESPASPVEEDERTSEALRVADTEFRTEGMVAAKPNMEDYSLEDPGMLQERGFPKIQGGESPERTSESGAREEREDNASDRDGERDFRDYRDNDGERESDVREGFRTQHDESSQDSTLIGEGSPRTGDRSGTLSPELSTNGEGRGEAVITAQNNGEREPLYVNNECGRVGQGDQYSYDNDSSTLLRDSSTYKAVVERETNSLDNGSDLTDKQSDSTEIMSDLTDRPSENATADNNNGLTDAGECGNSSVSSPLEDEAPLPIERGMAPRTDTMAKSLNANSHGESPVGGGGEEEEEKEEGLEMGHCGGEEASGTPAANTNSTPEEIRV